MKTNSLLMATILATSLLFSCDKNDDPENEVPSAPVTIRDSVIASALSHPWEITWGPDNKIWLTERGGKVSRLDPETGAISAIFTVPDVSSQGEGGLLGMAVTGGNTVSSVYLVYNYNQSGYKEKVIRYSYNGTTLVSPTTIIDNIPASNIHNGSRLLIIGDKLFISTGDANVPANAQNAASLSGKILRLNLDGSVPSDNPVPGNPYWTMGHRNPQGLVYANNRLYSSEHGPSNDDEINIIAKGKNYGWPNVEGYCNLTAEQTFCTANNVVEPIRAWSPTIAPSGMEYYNNDQIPQWKNSLILATLKDSRVYQLKLNAASDAVETTEEFFNGKYGRLRDVCQSPSGTVYLCTGNGSNDRIIKVWGVPD